MSMKKQPEGVKRTPRVAGEKPPQSYDIWLRDDKFGKARIGWSERLPKGMWQAHPEDGSDPVTIPPFAAHTALVEFLLNVHKGLEITSEKSSAAEDEAVQKGEEALEAEQQPDPLPASVAGDSASAVSGPSSSEPVVPDIPTTEVFRAAQPDPPDEPEREGAEPEFPESSEAETEAILVDPEALAAIAEAQAELDPPVGSLSTSPSRPAQVKAEVVQGEVVTPFQDPAPQESPEGSAAPQAESAGGLGAVPFQPPTSEGNYSGWEYPHGEGGDGAVAPVDFWGAVGDKPAQDEDMS